MKIISWNVNGIRSVAKKGLRKWFDQVDADIVCLQEVRAQEDQIPAEVADIPGYTRYWCTAEKKGYSGTAIYSRIPVDEVHYGFQEHEFDREGRVIAVELGDVVLYNIYFPNGGGGEDRLDYKLRFYDAFLEKSEEWRAKGKSVITCGDFNTCHQEIDIARPKENSTKSGFLPVERAWIDKYIGHGYVDTFRHFYPDKAHAYTWWSNRGGARERNVGWRLDYFFCDEDFTEKVKSSEIHPDVSGSDHCPISLVVG
jgi:exodeoxyribonuclease-3